jgi:hypothetical protein
MKKINGISQNAFATAAGIGWNAVSKLVMRGIVKPVANVGGQLFFNPDDAPVATAAIKQSTQADEEKYRPEWNKLSAKGQAEYGTFSAFVAYQKRAGDIREYSRGDNKRPTALTVRVGGAA